MSDDHNVGGIAEAHLELEVARGASPKAVSLDP
jgi:hypothetical protein